MTINVDKIIEAAKAAIADEVTEEAQEKLVELYRKREKAKLVLKNIDREIENYLADIEDNAVYASAGVDGDSK